MPGQNRIEVVVVGSLHMDVVSQVPHLPAPGECILATRTILAPGGKGGNQAVAAARLGANAAMIGRVGQDDYGSKLTASLAKHGVNIAGVSIDHANNSGTAFIIVDTDGTNLLIVSPGASWLLSPEDIETNAALIGNARFLLVQLEVRIESTIRAMEIARAAGATILLDPAPAFDIPDRLLGLADIITPNETELAALTGLPVSDLLSTRLAAESLLRRGARVVIAKLGAQGALIVDDQNAVHVYPRRVKAVDTTAAGDTFNGGLAAALERGADLIEAAQWANTAAALSTIRLGAQDSIPTVAETEAFFTAVPSRVDRI